MCKHTRDLYDAVYLSIIFAALFILTSFFMDDAKAKGLSRPQIEREIVAAALKHGVNPDLALAIAEVESGLNPRAIGGLGEIGIFQLRPEYHDVRHGNARHNIDVAIRYLAKLKRLCGSYGDAYFVCFNYGPARKLKAPKQFPYYGKVKATLKRNEKSLYLAEVR